MLTSFTAQNIIDRIRERADAETSKPTKAWLTDTHCLAYLNAGLRRLHVLERTVGGAVERSSTTITATGASSYALDASTGSVVAVYRVEGDRRIPLDRLGKDFEAEELDGEGSCYRVIKGSATYELEFYPNPASGTYEVRYTPGPTQLTAVTDTMLLPSVADEWLEAYGAYRALRREESADSANHLRADMAALWLDVEQMFRTIVTATPRRIHTSRKERDPADIHEMYPVR